MKPDRWRRVEEVFHAVLEGVPQAREQILAAACLRDPELRDEVESLLDRHASRDDLLSRGAWRQISQHLSPGERVDQYQVESLIGRGGMGEVYRARDLRLKRDVAIKIVPAILALDPMRIRRFEIEAQAAGSLNDPHIVAVYGFGYHQDCPYLVLELLQGESLRGLIHAGKLSTDKAIEIVGQAASGLAAAHNKGIVHRDIKPENLFLTQRGTLKILDFGIAQQAQERTEFPFTNTHLTAPGVMIGTTAYMSPEQVRGERVDQRSDLFSLGCVMYELVSGKRPFDGNSPADISSSILKDDPPPLECGHPSFERIVRHCLEKDMSARFQSAVDLRFALDSIAEHTVAPKVRKPTTAPLTVALVCLTLAALAVGYRISTLRNSRQPIHFERLTFGNGRIGSAHFAPDGTSVVYSAAWDGEPSQVFTVNPGNPESRPLGYSGAELLSVSSTGELALLLSPKLYPLVSVGGMAQVSITGGTPRRIVGSSCAAGWTPDGNEVLVVTGCNNVGHGAVMEYPLGHELYKTSGWISNPRFLPGTGLIGFLDHREDSSDAGYVAVIDKAGSKRLLGQQWNDIRGLSWNAKTREIWFTASEAHSNRALYATDLNGHQRLVYQAAENVLLEDIAESGRVLLRTTHSRIRTFFSAPGGSRARNLSLLDGSKLNDLSADGKFAVLSESLDAFRGRDILYLVDTRKIVPPTRLGEGTFASLSPDGRWVAARAEASNELLLYPTAEGIASRIPLGNLSLLRLGWLAPSSNSSHARVIFLGGPRGRPLRLYGLSPEGDHRVSRLPTNELSIPPYRISPDGKRYLQLTTKVLLQDLNGGNSHVLEGLPTDAEMYKWSRDGKSLYCVRQANVTLQISRYEIASGRLTPWREITPDDPAGLLVYHNFVVAADDQTYAYSYLQVLSVLFVVDGLR